MDKSLRLRILVCSAVALLSFWFLAPTFWDLYHPDSTEKRPSWMPNTAMRLGLDLQGGIHMVLGVDLDQVVRTQIQSYGSSLEKYAAEKGIPNVKTKVLAETFELEVTSPSPDQKEKLADLISNDFQVLEFVGDKDNIMVTRLNSQQENHVRTGALNQSIETIRNRIDEFGVSEPILSKKGNSQILVQFPGAKDPDRLKNLIGQTAQLNFQIVHNVKGGQELAALQADLKQKIAAVESAGNYNRATFPRLSEYRDRLTKDLGTQIPEGTELAFKKSEDPNLVEQVLEPYLLSTKNMIPGKYIEDASVQFDRDNGSSIERPVVAFRLNAAGTPEFAELTKNFVGSPMAIVLDGIIKSAPNIETPITGGSGRITLGRGDIEAMQKEAMDLAIVLRAGALPAKVEIQEERLIGPSIGKDAIELGKRSLFVTAILVFLFVWIYYGAVGMVANLVTLVNISCIFAFLGMIGATLTLPGIAGIVLTLGMAVDALIIIFERMREEKRLGRNSKQVIELGFDRAFATILDSNVTTAIGAFLLIQFGTGAIRGFGVTLLVGITINVFMATFFAKAMISLMVDLFGEGTLALGLPKNELKEIEART